MSHDDIEIEVRGRVAIAWLNRPAVLNAFRGATFDRLHAVLDAIREEPAARALVLTGRGRGFCAGEDLSEMGATSTAGFALGPARRELLRLQDLTRQLIDYPKPVVVAVNGPAVGLGAELPLAADVRIASESAYFWFSEARRSMLPTNGVFHLLPAIVRHGRAAEWLLTSRRIDAREALAAGLVSEVCGDGGLVERAVAIASSIPGR